MPVINTILDSVLDTVSSKIDFFFKFKLNYYLQVQFFNINT